MKAFAKRWLKTAVLLPVLGLFSFACAYRGWTIQKVGAEDAFFMSLEALKLGSEYKKSEGWAGNGWLEAARLFGLSFYFVTLFKAFGLLLRTQIRDLVAQLVRRDLVFIGDHPVLGGIAAAAARHGRAVLWLGRTEATDLPRRARMIPRAWNDNMVRQYRLSKARICVIAFLDDMAAVDATLQISRLSGASLILLPAGNDTGDAVRSLNLRRDVRTVPLAQPIVRTLHERYLPFLASRLAGQDALEVLIVGRGSVAEAVLTDLLLSSFTTFLARPRVTFLAPNAAQLAAELTSRFPELRSSVELAFVEAAVDWDGRGVFPALDAFPEAVTNAYVCLDDDRRSLGAAGALDRVATRRGWPVNHIFVHQEGGGTVWRAQAKVTEAVERIVPFGASDGLARSLGLLETEYDAHARYLHAAYCEFAEGAVARRPWEDLPEDLRDANRRQAAHLPAKLASLGVSLDGWTTVQNSDSALPVLPPVPDFSDQPMMLDRLARLEHDRWMVERRLNGWSYGEHRDDARRLHPDLVPFDFLSQRSKDYDRGMLLALSGHGQIS